MKRKDLVRISKTARPTTYEQRRGVLLRIAPQYAHPRRFARKLPEKKAA